MSLGYGDEPVACDIFRLTIQIGTKFDSPSKSGALTKMSLSLDIAQGNARRIAGRKGPAMLPARNSVLRPH